ncbi:MAG: tetratricopeptide repeat protein [Verrucomicrobia bacterium]|nr:tetratricopeptide repeat protein [Verrucomicrobiota bacterium]
MPTKENFLRASAGCVLALTALLAGCSPSGPGLLSDGEKLIKQGRFADAIRKLEPARDRLPKEARAWNLLGLAYHGQGRTREALESYRQALALNRDLVAARYNLGCLYSEQENYPAALNEFITFTSLRPNSAEAWTRLGVAQAKVKQTDAAEKSLTYALKLQSKNPEALNALGLIQVGRHKTRDAAAQFEEALAQDTGYAPALLNLAILRQQANDKAGALEKYHAYLGTSPKPANWNEVNALARAISAELNPQVTVPPPVTPAKALVYPPPPTSIAQTPRVTVTTNASGAPAPTVVRATPPPAKMTNAPPAVVATSNSLPRVTRTPTPTPAVPPKVSAPPAAAAAPKIEVVRVQDEVPIKPAADVAMAKPVTVEPPPAKSPTAVAINSARTTKPAAKAAEPAKEDQPSSGFWRKANPVHWFGGSSTNKAKPKPAPAVDADSVPAVTETVTTKPKSKSKSKSKPEPAMVLAAAKPADEESAPEAPRASYHYLNPAPGRPGNRAQGEKFFALGVKQHQAGKYTAAITEYLTATQSDPTYFDAYYNLGLAAFEAGHLGRSLSAYENALSIKPTDINTRYNFALALQKAGHPRDAGNELEKILAANTGEVRAHLTLAQLYAQTLQDKARARDHYEKVLALEPGHPQATAIKVWLSANSQ